jgi:hypothetical protein
MSTAPLEDSPSKGLGNTSSEDVPIDFGAAEKAHPSPQFSERIALETHWLRIGVAGITLLVFVALNFCVLYGVYKALLFDFKMLAGGPQNLAGTPQIYERFVTSTVIMSLLGATTVQLGAGMFAITKFLFPSAAK